MGDKAVKLSRMIDKRRGGGIMIQVPDMAQKKDMIPRLDLVDNVSHQDGRSTVQGGHAMALLKQVRQGIVSPSGEMQGMRLHIPGKDVYGIASGLEDLAQRSRLAVD